MSSPAVRYRITPKDPHAHLFEVVCTVARPAPEGQRLALPAWIPGSYMIRDFARNIVRLWAFDGEQGAVAVRKLDKQTWQCGACAGPLTVRYEVYAWDLSVRGAHLDATHGYFNGTSVFLRVEGFEDQPCEVDIRPPAAALGSDWRVATAMTRAGAPEWGFGTYRAQSYDELIDHPVEMGRLAIASFQVAGVPHHVAVYGRQRADLERLCRDLTRICQEHVALFGELPAMDRYVFLVTALGEGYGGLEHRASCSLMCSRNDLPQPGQESVSEDYRNFLALCSHEYFHTWNVKRIKPAAFTPYDLSREAHTTLLWAFEGITSYYDELALVRSGVISVESYLELLGQTITRVLRMPGRFKQSLVESSFDAWTKFYKQDENSPNAIVSYYTKGAVVALALDLTIRRETGGAHSLDDVMRALWRIYGRQDAGVPEEGVERVIAEETGLDLGELLNGWLRGTEDPDLERLFDGFGVRLHRRAAESARDKGGKPPADGAKRPMPVLGVRLATDSDAARLAVVFEGSSAHEAGLSAGDELVAVDGIRVTARNLETTLRNYAVGDRVIVHAFRRDELFEVAATLKAAPLDTCHLSLVETASPDSTQRRQAWLATAAAKP